MFNSLKYAKILEDSGLTRNQAEVHMQILTAVMEADMAMKSDIKNLENQIQKLEYKIIIKLGILITFVVPISMSLLQFLQNR